MTDNADSQTASMHVAQDGPVLLVGHSYGGAVITEAGNHPKVSGLVYIAEFGPDTGESVVSLIKDPPPDAPVPPILPPQDGYLFLDSAKFHDSFAAAFAALIEQAAHASIDLLTWRDEMFHKIRDHIRSGRGMAATFALILTLGLGLSVTAAAAASDGHDEQSPKPTMVFVHGGWADSSGWNDEITNLERRGYPVIVLVGHSYGGAVITNAAVGVPKVKPLVYIAGFAPDRGESLLQLVTMNPGTQIGPATLDLRQYPLPDGGVGTDV
jgi:pimeloyl-ACP methyl ester carboxylesterase